MKRVFVIAVIIVLGVVLFWWGHRSRNETAVMTPATEVVQDDASTSDTSTYPESASSGANSDSSPSAGAASGRGTAGEEEAPLQMRARDLNQLVDSTSNLWKRPAPAELSKPVLLSETRWKLWHGMKAVPASEFRSDRDMASGRVGGFVLVEDPSLQDDMQNFSANKPMVVYNERLQTTGVVTGSIQIVLNPGVNIEELVKDYGLKVVASFPETRVYFLTAQSDTFDLGSLLNVLKRDARVNDAKLEIVSRNYEKN
ncbi:MAG: hypothetical protein J7501_03265 [Bdellovibrio sp.]|nr:hypothetical protein [Bdellovibrio sp.]